MKKNVLFFRIKELLLKGVLPAVLLGWVYFHFLVPPKFEDFILDDPVQIPSGTFFYDEQGRKIGFDKLKSLNEVIVLTYWATWCGACAIEMPSLSALKDDMAPEGVRVFAVSVEPNDSAEKVRNFLDRKDFGNLEAFTDTVGGQRVSGGAQKFGVRSVPTNLIIDKQGRLVLAMSGVQDWSSPSARQYLRKLAQEG